MSDAVSPSGRPVSPPIANMGRNAVAKSIGVVKRIAPPYSDMMKQVRITTEGMEMIMVVVWKKVLIVVPMPVMNMWWAHTTKGSRQKVSPFARSCTVVTMKLIEPSKLEVMSSTMAKSHAVCPGTWVISESGG